MSAAGQPGGTVLVVGADGLVGSALFRAFSAHGPVLGTSRRAGSEFLHLDLAEPPGKWPTLPPVSVAYLCAAVTALRQCREHPVESRQVNLTHTVTLAGRLVAQGTRVVFFSTGLVFDGTQSFWPESAPLNPQCEYGRQKAEAERQILAVGESAAVVRLAKVVAPGMPLFRRWVEDLRAGKVIRPFADYVMSPITLSFVAEAMQALAAGWGSGVWHLGADADVSYAAAASRLAARLGVSPGLVQPTTSQAAGADLEFLPRHSTLGTARLRTELGLITPSAAAALDDCFASL
jgi:dTDP-4-dehydrorhamnose reductase